MERGRKNVGARLPRPSEAEASHYEIVGSIWSYLLTPVQDRLDACPTSWSTSPCPF